MSKRVKTCQKICFLTLFDTIFWHLRSGSVGVQVRVKTCQKHLRVKKCLHAPACQKTKPSFSLDVSCQNVSKRVKNVSKTYFFDTLGASKRVPTPCRSYPTRSKSVKACQNVSKKNENARKHNVFQECQNVSIRVKTCQKVVACQNVSKKCQKSVKKVSKKCQKRVKTC